jgi:hypothetical protein
MANDAEKSPRWKRPLAVVGGAGLLFLALFAYWHRHPEESIIENPSVELPADPKSYQPLKDPPAPAAMTGMLGDLKVGSSIGPWQISAMTVSSKEELKGALALVLVNGKKSFVVSILAKGPLVRAAAYQTEGFTFHTGQMVETDKEETKAPVEVLVKRVRTFEGHPDAPLTVGTCSPEEAASAQALQPAGSAAPRASAAPPRP